MNEPKDNFLARWSQRKTQAREAEPAAAQTVPAEPGAAAADPALPSLESLTGESDFSAFMRPDVDPALRRAALGKLFSDPRFNLLDGLDTYIDDYTKADPLPVGMLEKLTQWQNILAAQQPQPQPHQVAAGDAAAGAPPDPLPPPQLDDGRTLATAPPPAIPDATGELEPGVRRS